MGQDAVKSQIVNMLIDPPLVATSKLQRTASSAVAQEVYLFNSVGVLEFAQ